MKVDITEVLSIVIKVKKNHAEVVKKIKLKKITTTHSHHPPRAPRPMGDLALELRDVLHCPPPLHDTYEFDQRALGLSHEELNKICLEQLRLAMKETTC